MLRTCKAPGCLALTLGGYCVDHDQRPPFLPVPRWMTHDEELLLAIQRAAHRQERPASPRNGKISVRPIPARLEQTSTASPGPAGG